MRSTETTEAPVVEITKKWFAKTAYLDSAKVLSSELGIHPLVARVLTTRNCSQVESARAFMNPSKSLLYSPLLMHDMDKAAKRIKRAIDSGELIAIIGDYDVDGTTATALMVKALKSLGGKIVYIIPSRFEDGYGINVQMVEACYAKGASLIITVDNGISAIEPAAVAKELKIDLIVSDHHLIPDELPKTYATVHPSFPRHHYPTRELCGCGVAFKLVEAILDRFPEEYLELVALATIADQVSLTGENRVLVQMGLEQLNKSPSLGISALLYISGLQDKRITSDSISFQIASRINAVGRMARAERVVDLLLTEDPDEAIQIAQETDGQNRFRRSIQERVEREAMEQIASHPEWIDDKAIVVASEGWHEVCIGIAAGRLSEQFYLPAICISVNGDIAKGSARSIPGCDIYDALRDVDEHASGLLLKYGGHSGAAGFSLKSTEIERFRKAFCFAVKRNWSKDTLPPHIFCDAPLELEDLSFQLTGELKRLEPFGRGNTQPIFLIKNALVTGKETFGAGGKHLKIWVEDNFGRYYEIVAFRKGKEIEEWNLELRYHLLVTVGENIWQNTKRIQMQLVDHREA